MTSVQQQAELLKAECERLAREAETIMLGVGLTDAERLEASEKARVYRQMATAHSETITNAEKARPSKFTSQNRGLQLGTRAKLDLIQSVRMKVGDTKRQSLANAIWAEPSADAIFGSYESLYRFLGRKDIF